MCNRDSIKVFLKTECSPEEEERASTLHTVRERVDATERLFRVTGAVLDKLRNDGPRRGQEVEGLRGATQVEAGALGDVQAQLKSPSGKCVRGICGVLVSTICQTPPWAVGAASP